MSVRAYYDDGQVALHHGEVNEDYLAMAARRIGGQLGMLAAAGGEG